MFCDEPVRIPIPAAWPLGPPERIPKSFPSWWADLVPALIRDYAGPFRDEARSIAWGDREPIRGWRIEFEIVDESYRIALVDTIDPCSFTIRPGEPARPESPRPPAIVVFPRATSPV